MLDNIFLQVSALLAVTVTIACVMRLLRQPLIVAYIVAGILSGPLFLNLLHGDTAIYDALAQFGVVLLLFVVGLSLNFEHIKRIGKVSLIVGLTQIIFTFFIGFGLLQLLGFSFVSASYLAIGVTFSSTIIIVKLLAEKKDTESMYGRYTLGLMVIQDVVAVLILMSISTLSHEKDAALLPALGLLLGKIALLAVVVYILSRFVLPRVLDRVARSGEFLFLFTVAWCFGVASILHLLGFSIEIGAIIAGLSLGSSPYQSEISSRIKPLRDFFIVLFFIILGSHMTIAHIQTAILPAILLSLFILIGDPFILYHSFRLQQFTRRNSFLAATTAAHVSEFGFVLLFTGMTLGHINGSEMEIFTLVALITIIISSYAITYNEKLYHVFLPLFHAFGPDRHRQRDDDVPVYDAWIFGYHRIGWKVVEALKDRKMRVAVVDFNPRTTAFLKRQGIDAYFGDASDIEFLTSLPLEKAALIVSTIPQLDDQLTLVSHIRKLSKKTFVIANLSHFDDAEILYKAGADYVMMPHMLGGNWIADVLRKKPLTKPTLAALRKEQKEDIKRRMKEVGREA